MKIGILTFHLVPNYGAALQAFALMEYLRQKGHEVSIIDYRCPGNDGFSPSRIFSKKIVSYRIKYIAHYVLSNLLSKKTYCQKYIAFCKFWEGKYVLSSLDKDSFDAVFCGSDQIWNPSITKGLDKTFFGLHDAVVFSKKIAYAASCGDVNSLSLEDKELLVSYVRRMDAVSIREKPLNDLLVKKGIDSEVVLDPSFLLSKDDYIKHFYDGRFNNQDYILVYELHKVPSIPLIAKAVAKQKNLKIVYVCGYQKMTFFCHNHVYSAGPVEFINYIAKAKYVVTNSFHGLAFSLIFEKDFNVCLPKVRKERLTNLLDSVGLLDRIVAKVDSINTTSIDYNQVNQKKKALIDISKMFIDKVLV